MKKIILGAACALMIGCVGAPGSLDPLVQSDLPVQMKVTVPETRTAEPDGTTVVVPAHEEVQTTTVKTITVNPKWTSVISTASDLNSTMNPTPFAPLVSLFFMATTGVLGVFAHLKNKDANAGQLIVKGIENLNDPTVKSNIEKSVALFGSKASTQVDNLVQKTVTNT